MIRGGAHTLLLLILITWDAIGQVKVISYYDADSSKLKEVMTLKDSTSGVLHGPFVEYFDNGKIKSKGSFSDNFQNGDWEYYYENGNLKSKGNLLNGVTYGVWQFYYENGQVSRKGNISNDKKQDAWQYFYENGGNKAQGQYVNDLKEGIWNFFYEEGNIKAQGYFRSDAGKYKEFYPSGHLKNEGVVVSGQKEGAWIYYYPSGEKQAYGLYQKGDRQGLWRFYHQSGALLSNGRYRDNMQTGEWKYFYETGELASKGKKNEGRKDGFWELYYESGEVKAKGEYLEGNGDYIEYYPNGAVKSKGAIKEGKYDGEWLFFKEDGTLDGRGQFELGSGVYTTYYSDSTVKSTGEVKDGKRVGTWKLNKPDGTLAGYNKIIYEEEEPIFYTDLGENPGATQSIKPEFHRRKRKSRYFIPRLNEYKGYILATNPLAPLVGNLPFSLEYYIQERLGYEFQYVFIRRPFFLGNQDIGNGVTYRRGASLKLRQKFYNLNRKGGMIYFGHEIGVRTVETRVNLSNITGALRFPQTTFEYGVFIGNRWMKKPDNASITVDTFLGFGLGYRIGKLNADYSDEQRAFFSEVNQTALTLPFTFGIMIGRSMPRAKKSGLNF